MVPRFSSLSLIECESCRLGKHGVRLSKKAKTNKKSTKKRTVGDKNGQNTKMEASNGRTKELRNLSAGDEPNGRSWWPEGHSCALMRHPHVDVWGTSTKGHARDGEWALICRSSCLWWIDRLPTSQLVRGISPIRVVVRKVRRL